MLSKIIPKQKPVQNLVSSYKNKVKERFMKQINNITNKYSLQQLILITDLSSAILISNLFTVTQLVDIKIVYLQRLEVKRKKMNMHALYFIEPTKTNVQLLINDFPQLTKQQKKQYKKIHVLFTTFIEKPLLRQIALHKPLLSKIAHNSIKQFYHSSRLLCSNTINFQIQYMNLAYSKDSHQQIIKRTKISKKIAEIVANLGQINNVRIYFKKSTNSICQNVTQYTKNSINKYISSLYQNKSPNLNKNASDITILMLDRSVDPITPLLHTFTYESMLFDLMKVQFQGSDLLKDKSYYSFQQIEDSIYQQFRYQHISKALEQLPQRLQEVNDKLAAFQKGHKGDNQIDIAELNEKLKSLRKHIDLVDLLFKQFKNKKLDQVGQIQLSLATGLTQDGKNTSSSQLISDVLQEFKKNQKLTQQQKIRLILLIFCSIKLSKKDYQKLLELFSAQQQWILKNIIALGVTYDKNTNRSTKAITKQQQNVAAKRLQQKQISLDRYTPLLEQLIPMFIQILSGKNPKVKKLNESVFGSVKCATMDQVGLDIPKFNQERFVIIMLGGLSFAQISALKNKKELQNILLVTDDVISPNKYLQMLSKIDILK